MSTHTVQDTFYSDTNIFVIGQIILANRYAGLALVLIWYKLNINWDSVTPETDGIVVIHWWICLNKKNPPSRNRQAIRLVMWPVTEELWVGFITMSNSI